MALLRSLGVEWTVDKSHYIAVDTRVRLLRALLWSFAGVELTWDKSRVFKIMEPHEHCCHN